MTWSSPRTWTTAEFITRSIFQTSVRDELLATATAMASAKGDSFWASAANTVGRLPVGPNDNQIMADSTQALGVRWGTENMVPIRLWLPNMDFVFADRPGGGTVTWPAANRVILLPFYLSEAKTLAKIRIFNGSPVSGNLDAGIYDASGTKVVTLGSTAQSGTNAQQILDIADTALSANTLYYAALILDNTTGTVGRATPGIAAGQLHGMKQVASSIPLGASLTYAAIASDFAPNMILEFTA